eukprot:CAMPEP_0184677376 /NCGR_PEP_ID=MMETSP0308-20130426/88845_1 /TAXON_ID=38269 /ORGANISM="Gloeochaete witrockiana, Strain SAG 46.84" /LENGTH=638 /DNA_ID=CAMNT_0027125261 /DNA_START=451 /DNA_END=2367 /DNA_ORIENTATION=+
MANRWESEHQVLEPGRELHGTVEANGYKYFRMAIVELGRVMLRMNTSTGETILYACNTNEYPTKERSTWRSTSCPSHSPIQTTLIIDPTDPSFKLGPLFVGILGCVTSDFNINVVASYHRLLDNGRCDTVSLAEKGVRYYKIKCPDERSRLVVDMHLTKGDMPTCYVSTSEQFPTEEKHTWRSTSKLGATDTVLCIYPTDVNFRVGWFYVAVIGGKAPSEVTVSAKSLRTRHVDQSQSNEREEIMSAIDARLATSHGLRDRAQALKARLELEQRSTSPDKQHTFDLTISTTSKRDPTASYGNSGTTSRRRPELNVKTTRSAEPLSVNTNTTSADTIQHITEEFISPSSTSLNTMTTQVITPSSRSLRTMDPLSHDSLPPHTPHYGRRAITPTHNPSLLSNSNKSPKSPAETKIISSSKASLPLHEEEHFIKKKKEQFEDDSHSTGVSLNNKNKPETTSHSSSNNNAKHDEPLSQTHKNRTETSHGSSSKHEKSHLSGLTLSSKSPNTTRSTSISPSTRHTDTKTIPLHRDEPKEASSESKTSDARVGVNNNNKSARQNRDSRPVTTQNQTTICAKANTTAVTMSNSAAAESDLQKSPRSSYKNQSINSDDIYVARDRNFIPVLPSSHNGGKNLWHHVA